jgi:hypothetical protein
LRHVSSDLICIGLDGAATSVAIALISSVSVTIGACSIYVTVNVIQSAVPVVGRVIAIVKVRPGAIRPEWIVIIGPERERKDVAEEIGPKHWPRPSAPTAPTTAPVKTASSTKASGYGKAIPPALIAERISIEAASATKLAAPMGEATAPELSAPKPTTTELAAPMGEATTSELSAPKPTTTELTTTMGEAAAAAKPTPAEVTPAEVTTTKATTTKVAAAKVPAAKVPTAEVAAAEVAATAEMPPSKASEMPSTSAEMPSTSTEMPSAPAEMSAATSTMPSAKGHGIVRKRDRDERCTRHQRDDDLARDDPA